MLTGIEILYIIFYRKVCTPKGGSANAENVSTEEASQKKRARLQKENGRQKRSQSFGSPQSERQSALNLLMKAGLSAANWLGK